jgi:hypothetical protein
MNYRHCILILVSLAGMAGCDQLQPVTQTGSADTAAVAAAPAPTGPVLATVNGTAITQGAYEVYSGQRKPQGASEAANNKEAILNELVALELMRQESVSKGLDTKAEVIAALDQQNRTTLAGAAIKEFMSNNSVTDEDAQAFYDAQMATPAKEFNARHILVKTEDDAVAVIAELDNGADFSELAKENPPAPQARRVASLAGSVQARWSSRLPMPPRDSRKALTPKHRSRHSSAGMSLSWMTLVTVHPRPLKT